MTTLQDIERRLSALLEENTALLSCELLEHCRSLVAHGEPGVALENLCTQLYEYEVAVPDSVVQELAALGGMMGIDAVHWTVLDTRPG